MRIRILTLQGKSIFVDNVDLNLTVGDLKDKIEKITGIHSEDQRYIYRGRGMEDQRTLGDYNVEENSPLHLVLRLRCDCWHLRLKKYPKLPMTKITENWEEEFNEKVLKYFDRNQIDKFKERGKGKRIFSEIKKCYMYRHPNLVSLEFESPPSLNNNNSNDSIEKTFSTWVFTLLGPKDSPYRDGHFKFRFHYIKEFPFRTPELKVLTRIFHPMFGIDGGLGSCTNYYNEELVPNTHLCSLIPKNDWSPVYTLMDIIDLLVVDQLQNFEQFYEKTRPKFPESENCYPMKLLEDGEIETYWMEARDQTLKFARSEFEKKNFFNYDPDENERIKFCVNFVETQSVRFSRCNFTDTVKEIMLIPKLFLL